MAKIWGRVLAGTNWSEAVEIAVRRLVARHGNVEFSRRQLIDEELPRIIKATGSTDLTPEMTLSRELQQMRDRGEIDFVEPGLYRFLLDVPELPLRQRGKCVFVIGSHSIYKDEPDRFYRFPPRWLNVAARSLGQWILYQEPRRAGPRGYYAVARVEQIVRDPSNPDMFLALIEPGSFLEFGRDVPFHLDGQAVEQGLLDAGGRLNNGRAIQSIRPIADADFNRIVGLGLIEDDELLPRDNEEQTTSSKLEDRQTPFFGMTDRATILVERKVRDRQFRKRVLEVYDRRCAFTGMQLINGGGRAETEAAHIMSVEAGGPDAVVNGIALSGTVHWMFDRGLISLTDAGNILLSSKINNIASVERLLHPDSKARLPGNEDFRPHPRYLAWHRAHHSFS